MATNGFGALALPFTDADFAAGSEISVRVGATFFTTTVPLPSTVPTPHGYYSFGDATDDLAAAVVTSLTADDPTPGAWSVVRTTTDKVNKYEFQKVTSDIVTFRWTTSSFPAEYLGFDPSVDYDFTLGGSFPFNFRRGTAPWNPGRVWFPPHKLWQRRLPSRVAAVSRSYSGAVSKRTYSDGWHDWDLKHGPVPEAHLLNSAVEDLDLSLMVPGLSPSDPNFALENLWFVAGKYTPFRWTPDFATHPNSFYELEIRDRDWLEVYSTALTEIAGSSPPQWRVTLPLQGYKTTGVDFSISEIVCPSGGLIEVVDVPDLISKVGSNPVDSVFTYTYTDPLSGGDRKYTWRKVADTGNIWEDMSPRLGETPQPIPTAFMGSWMTEEVGTFATNPDGSVKLELTGSEPANTVWTKFASNRAKVLTFGAPVPGLVGVRAKVSNPTRNGSTFFLVVALAQPNVDVAFHYGCRWQSNGILGTYQNASTFGNGAISTHDIDTNTPYGWFGGPGRVYENSGDAVGGNFAWIGIGGVDSDFDRWRPISNYNISDTNIVDSYLQANIDAGTLPQQPAIIITGAGNTFDADLYEIELFYKDTA